MSTQVCSYGIDSSGNLFSWGSNGYGTIGNQSIVTKAIPTPTLGTDYSSILTSSLSVFAQKTDGTIWCWGKNTNGQLGLSNVIHRSSPVFFSASGVWSKIENGYSNSLGIKTDGSLWAWGRNDAGQLGTNNTIHRSSPVLVSNTGTWVDVSCDYYSSYGVKSDGTLWAWGTGYNFAWGNGTNVATIVPGRSSMAQIGTATDWSNVSAVYGLGGIALKKDGTLWSWGIGSVGKNGNNSTITASSPTQVIGSGYVYVKSSWYTLLAKKSDNTYWIWGQTWDGSSSTSVNRSSPVQVAGSNFRNLSFSKLNVVGNGWPAFYGIAPVPSIVATTSTTTTSTTSTTPAAEQGFLVWGNNTDGVLGIGDTVHRSRGVQLGTDSQWNSGRVLNYSTSGSNHTLITKWDGSLWGCGNNTYGQIGDGTLVNKSSPVQITGAWANAVSGAFYTVGVKTDGSIWAWGRYIDGSLGTTFGAGDQYYPYRIGLDYNWSGNPAHLDASRHVAAIKTNGTLWAWGYNGLGQLGNGTVAHRSSPTQIGTETTWTQVSVGGAVTSPYQSHTIAVKSDGTAWAWGANSNGQLGDNSVLHRSSPVQVLGTGYKYAKAGFGFSLAVKTNGSLWGWGDYTYSGTNYTPLNYANRSSPVQLLGTTSWSTNLSGFDTKYISSVGLNSTGPQNLWNWGSGTDGALYQISNVANIFSPLDSTSYPSGLNRTWSSAYQGYQRGAAGALVSLSAFGLIADWDPRNYVSGTTWTDASGTGNNATISNTDLQSGFVFRNEYSGYFAETSSAGYLSNAFLYYYGTYGEPIYITGTKAYYYSDDVRDQSFEIWARLKPSNSTESIANVGPFSLKLNYDQLVVTLNETTIITPASKYTDWMFHQFTVTNTGTTTKLYVDGSLVSTATNSGLYTSGGYLSLGATSCHLAKFRAWYGVVRTDAEILADYNSWKAIANYPVLTTRNTYSYTGSDQTWTCPVGVTSIYATAIGAMGGSLTHTLGTSRAGNGGSITGKLTVTPGVTYRIVVGKSGDWSSGSTAPYGYAGSFSNAVNTVATVTAGAFGGGLAGIFATTVSQANALLVAGGGGGGQRLNIYNCTTTAVTHNFLETGWGAVGSGPGGSGRAVNNQTSCVNTSIRNGGTLTANGAGTSGIITGGSGSGLTGGTGIGYSSYTDGLSAGSVLWMTGGSGGAGYYGGAGSTLVCASYYDPGGCGAPPPSRWASGSGMIPSGGGSSYSADANSGHAFSNTGGAPWGFNGYVVICY
jgi:hypothetical protein